ncbi:MAG: hypothetical protein KDJ39_04145 [Gammaproteobacteria bacterium]|nr:hypothetical protein [Gammaproteobacteria bacterium]MCP5298640.1 hypothetical protein [Chromatiaceae bacterium]
MFGDIALDEAVDAGVAFHSLEGLEELGQPGAAITVGLALVIGRFFRRQSVSCTLSWGGFTTGLAVVPTTAWFGRQHAYDLGVNVAVGAPGFPSAKGG